MSRQRVSVHVVPEASGLRRVDLRCPHHGTVTRLARPGEHWRTTTTELVPQLRATGCRHAIDMPGNPFTPGRPEPGPAAQPSRSGVPSAHRAGTGHPTGDDPT